MALKFLQGLGKVSGDSPLPPLGLIGRIVVLMKTADQLFAQDPYQRVITATSPPPQPSIAA